MLPFFLKPSSIRESFHEIDRTAPSFSTPPPAEPHRSSFVLGAAAFSLLLLHYLRFSTSFDIGLRWFADILGKPQDHFVQLLLDTGFKPLIDLGWWTFCHVLTFGLIPLIVIKGFLNERLRDHGWRWAETHEHWRGYAVLLGVVILLVVAIGSQRADFIAHYPFYDHASRSWLDLLVWEMLYLTQFLLLEFFFRGFLLHSLRPLYGSAAIWIMIVPYCMLHFPKPWLEATGSIFFGLFLGILALRSRSIWGGFLVHAGVAISMDFASLLRRNALPVEFWPSLTGS